MPISAENIAGALPEIDLINDQKLRGGVRRIWEQLGAESRFDDLGSVPVTTKMQYSHVTHNRAVVAMALAVADILHQFHGTSLDTDSLLASALLQDVSKLVEYEPTDDGQTRLSELGERFPHAFYGAHAVLAERLPPEIAETVLTHTFHSPQFPRTLEAKLLFYLDQIDVAAIGGDRWIKRSVLYR